VRRGKELSPHCCSSETDVRDAWSSLPKLSIASTTDAYVAFQCPRIESLSEIGIEFLELSGIKLRMKFREAGCEGVEDRSHALNEHELSETIISLEASNE
jgi:hypothetical protein